MCDAWPIMSSDPDGARVLAASVLLRVPELTDALVRTIQERNPAYREVKVVPLDDLRQSCHDNITRVLQLLATAGGAPDDDPYFDAPRATARRRAEQRSEERRVGEE